MERRRAYDGFAYTFAEFSLWYAESALYIWNAAPEVRQHVDGLWYTNEEYDAVLRLEAEMATALEAELDEFLELFERDDRVLTRCRLGGGGSSSRRSSSSASSRS